MGKSREHKVDTSWDEVNKWYSGYLLQKGTLYDEIVVSNLLRILKKYSKSYDKPTVIDIGCGDGKLAEILHQRGYSVSGLDNSRNLLETVKKRKLPGKFIEHDATKDFDLGKFNFALNILTASNINNIQRLYINNAKSLLENGLSISVITHPCFRMPRRSDWGWDSEKKIQYRRLEGYMTPYSLNIDVHPFHNERSKIDGGGQSITYHRNISEYINTIVSSGMNIFSIEEWVSNKQSQPGPKAKAENYTRSEFPVFLCIIGIVK